MQRFKSIILSMQGKNKSSLHWLYDDVYNPEFPEKAKIFSYCSLRFRFGGTGFRNSEKLLLFVDIPVSFAQKAEKSDAAAVESCLLIVLSPMLNELSREYVNEAKNAREKAQFEAQKPDELMLRRSGIRYDAVKKSAELTIHFNVPLVNALSINAKAAVRAVKDILESIEGAVKAFDHDLMSAYILCHRRQTQIRELLKNRGLCAFVANGSILPRENGEQRPMEKAIPFISPKETETTVTFEDGGELRGMGVGYGVTVVTGGGYSGKSTLLDAIEAGIYDHIPGDGREYVITDDSALKIYAEDGRPVHSLDLSPFFKRLPGDNDVGSFTTSHASGSVSQAANIIEAVCGGSRLLLIDEDRSATNFMILDRNMRKVVKNEPIIPFTDRVRELYRDKGVSTMLVIGGSSEYLTCADRVILMDDYAARDITAEVGALGLPENVPDAAKAGWTDSRRLIPRHTTQAFLYFSSVETENEKKIILDGFSADITLLTSVETGDQMNALACLMEQLLTDERSDEGELIEKAAEYTAAIFSGEGFQSKSMLADASARWYEEIRPLDGFCCANRMRGLRFR